MQRKINHFLTWLPLTVAVASVPACGVELNDKPYATDEETTPECDAATRSRVRILQAAATATLAPPSKPEVPQTVALKRPDPADPAETITIASMRFNATASVTLCPGTTNVALESQVLNGDQIETIDVGAFDFEIAPMKRYTLVITGNVTPAAGEDELQHIVIDETAIPAPVGDESNIILVNAITDSPTLSANTDGEDGNEIDALLRYGTSALVPVKPGDATIALLDGATTKASFTIEGFPQGDNLIAILYNKFAPAKDSTKTQARLFLTGSDPLIGNAPGNGIKLAAD